MKPLSILISKPSIFSKFGLKLFSSKTEPFNTKLSSLWSELDYGRIIKIYHDTVAADQEVSALFKCLCLSCLIKENKYVQARKILVGLIPLWENVYSLPLLDQESQDGRLSSKEAIEWLLGNEQYFAVSFIRNNIPKAIWLSWGFALHKRILQGQFYTSQFEHAAETFCYLTDAHAFQDPIILDKLLFHTSISSPSTFARLIQQGYKNKIRMSPGFVNAAIFRQAIITKKTDQTPSNFEKGFSIEELLTWAAQLHSEGYLLQARTWGKLLVRIIGLRGAAIGLQVLRALAESGMHVPTMMTYSVVMHGFVKEGNVDQAEKLFREMTSKGIQPNVVVLGTLLNAHVRQRNVAAVKQLIGPMDIRGLGVIGTTMLINLAIHTSSNMSLAEEIYQHFLAAGNVPNPYLFGTLLLGYFIHKDQVGAQKLLREMKEPNLFILNLLINMSASEVGVNQAMAFTDAIIARGFSPNLTTYHSLMNVFRIKGQPNKVQAVFRTLGNRGLSPTLYTYNMLILAHSESDNPHLALKAYHDLKNSGISPSTFTMAMMLNLVGKYQLLQYIDLLLKDIRTYQLDKHPAILAPHISRLSANSCYR